MDNFINAISNAMPMVRLLGYSIAGLMGIIFGIMFLLGGQSREYAKAGFIGVAIGVVVIAGADGLVGWLKTLI